MKAFYGSRFSPHMTKTPEGFLICHSVPICRTGEQEYLPREIGVEEEKRPIITILKELRSQSEITGMWTNITDEDIEKTDDTIQDPNEGMGDMDGLFGNAPSSSGKQGESRENNNHDSLHGPGESAQSENSQRTMDS